MVWRYLRGVRPLDIALAAAFAAFGLAEEQLVWSDRGDGWWPYALAFFTAVVALRRVFPVLAMVASTAAAFAATEADTYRLWQLVAMVVAAFTIGQLVPLPGTSWIGRWRAVLGAALVFATALAYLVAAPTDPMAALFFPIAPYGLGVAVAMQARRMAEAASARAAIREQRAREMVMEERVRIARELHDMVAHSVTVMVIQAGVVRRRLDAGLAVDTQLLRGIEASGRDAVGELRRTLGLLRGDARDATPAPVGLDRLDNLVAQVREAGLAVVVRRDGTEAPLPPALDVSAYRIIQEALTNVLKHAGTAAARVELSYRPDGLRLFIVNEGGTRPAAGAGSGTSAGGHGMIGMRERVMLFGGELTAGPRPGGGFAVHARLPVLAAVAS